MITTAQNPANLSPSDVPKDLQEQNGLPSRSDKILKASVADAEMNKLDVKEVKNISGTILLISDLKSDMPDAQALSLEPNQVVDLQAIFEPKQINRSVRLREAIELKDNRGNPCCLAIVSKASSPDNRIDWPDVKAHRLVGQGEVFAAPYNDFDKKYEKVIADEEKRNEKQNSEARRTRTDIK